VAATCIATVTGGSGRRGSATELHREEEKDGDFLKNPLAFAVFHESVKNRVKTISICCFGLFRKPGTFKILYTHYVAPFDHLNKYSLRFIL
jgi:hypothetical protein